MSVLLRTYISHNKSEFEFRHKKICAFLLALLVLDIIFLISPFILHNVIFHMPGTSNRFDCDDAALLMYDKLTARGLNATAILGNLSETNEQYADCNHVWVLVKVAGLPIALDWGVQYLDKQHYEGYALNRAQLFEFVQQDLKAAQSIENSIRPAATP
jgi:hypothetical protein